MSFLSQFFKGKQEREAYRPLYNAIVNAGRDPAWYIEGQVPDTINGRFDMIAAVLSLTLIRLESEDGRARAASVYLAELFIDDMEGTIRELGIGDVVVGKHMGKLMGALGGRLNAFRSEIESGGDFRAPVTRNIFRDAPPSEAAVAAVGARMKSLYANLLAVPADRLLDGEFPKP